MTAKQQEVFDQVHELLSEHFEGHVFVVDAADMADSSNHEYGTGYNGGVGLGMGLCEYAKGKMNRDIYSEA